MNLNDGIIKALAFDSVASANAFYIISLVLVIAASYLLGSINSAIIVSKLVYRDDVRKHGSGNPGTTNMLRSFGKVAAAMTLLGDMAKTALSILLAGVIFGFNYVYGISSLDGYCYIAGLFSVLGHVFPVYYGFKGGKGVLSTATMALILSPVPFLILLLLFVALVAWTKYVSLGSVSAAVLYPVALHATFSFIGMGESALISLSSITIAILIVWCHRANLQRISDRTENKISFGKKKKEPEETPEEYDEKEIELEEYGEDDGEEA